MDPGELNKRIVIVQKQTARNENGFDEPVEVELCKCWAKATNKSGKEVYKANADYSKTITRFLIRYRKDIDFKQKNLYIKFDDMLYEIKYSNNYNFSNKFIEIITELII